MDTSQRLMSVVFKVTFSLFSFCMVRGWPCIYRTSINVAFRKGRILCIEIFLLTVGWQCPKITWNIPSLSLLQKRNIHFKNEVSSPGWCGSVDWVLVVNQRVASLIPSIGHIPGLQARSPVGGAHEATTHRCFSPSLSLPFPSQKINKIL